ncbi:hypothetical protein like AT3G14280 [Hibiscus trionum]|uniref:Remorin family protein n=1 Tax=Hibiscus trionum TaxID=183268 RepID=A0A9W7M9W6_HIBTR|nr:hypothetical protein like AT3G14280 [Hibiscus trionum]
MSLTSSFPLHVPATASSSLAKHVDGIVMLRKNHVPNKKTPNLRIRSFSKVDGVFEDQSEGVICYRDENGEMVCEGYDEGPRFRQRTFYHLRDAEILDLLQDRWLQIVNGVNNF